MDAHGEASGSGTSSSRARTSQRRTRTVDAAFRAAPRPPTFNRWRFNDPALERDFSRYCIDKCFIYFDQASWFLWLILVAVVYVKVVNSSLYLLSAIPFLLQGTLIIACPEVYKQYRTDIVLALRCFRISMTYRVTAFPYTIDVYGVKDCYKLLLIFSGALPHAALSISYNLPMHLHLWLQLLACVLAYKQFTPICCGAISTLTLPTTAAGPAGLPAPTTTCAHISWFGLPSTAPLDPLPCSHLFAVIMAFVGFLMPTYVVYVMDATLRVMFVAQLRHGRPERPRCSIGTSIAKHAAILLMATLLCHKLIKTILLVDSGSAHA